MATGTVTKPAVRSVWGTTAGAANISDPGDPFVAAGWPLSPNGPTRQYDNWLENYVFNGVRYQCARGLPDWDATETFYTVGSVVIGDNGLIYAALQAGPNAATPGTNSNKAPSASPTYWGSVGVPTAAANDNSNKIASTAFVAAAAAVAEAYTDTQVAAERIARESTIAAEGSARVQGDLNTLASAESYTSAAVAPLAPKASPAFTGAPTAPTAGYNASTAQLATTAFANPGASVTANGYQVLPSGLILQWGVVVGVNGGAGPVSMTFPLAFPAACFGVTASSKRSLTGTVATGGTNNLTSSPGTTYSTTGAIIVCDRDSDGVQRAAWFAIGH